MNRLLVHVRIASKCTARLLVLVHTVGTCTDCWYMNRLLAHVQIVSRLLVHVWIASNCTARLLVHVQIDL